LIDDQWIKEDMGIRQIFLHFDKWLCPGSKPRKKYRKKQILSMMSKIIGSFFVQLSHLPCKEHSMKNRIKAIVFVLAVNMAISLPAIARTFAAPHVFEAQGRLLNSAGQPVTDGNHQMSFSVWDDSVTGSQYYFENGDIPTQDGRFNFCLGCNTPFNSLPDSGAILWVQVTVEGQVLAPRIRLGSIPYAMSSSSLAGDVSTKPGGMTFADPNSFFDLDSDSDGVTMRLRESPSKPSLGFTATDHSSSIAIGDVDGDGALDFAADASGQSIRLRESPTRSSIDISGSGAGGRVAIGNLNGDGNPDVLVTGENNAGEVVTARETGSGMATGRRNADATIFTDSTGEETARYTGHVTLMKRGTSSSMISPDSVVITSPEDNSALVMLRESPTRHSTGRYSADEVMLRESPSRPSLSRVSIDGLSITDSTGEESAIYRGHVTLMKRGESSSRMTSDSLVITSPDDNSALVMIRESPTKQSLGRYSADGVMLRESPTLPSKGRLAFDGLAFDDDHGDSATFVGRYHQWHWNNSRTLRVGEDCDDTDAGIAIDEAGVHRVSIHSSGTTDESSIAIDEPGVQASMKATPIQTVLRADVDTDGDGTMDESVQSGASVGGADGPAGGFFAIKENGVKVVDLSSDALGRRLTVNNIGSSGQDGVSIEARPESTSLSLTRLNGLPPGEPVIGSLKLSTTNDASSIAVGDLDGDGRADLSANTNGARCLVANIGSSGEDGVSVRATDTGSSVSLYHRDQGQVPVSYVDMTRGTNGGAVISDVMQLRPRPTEPTSPAEGQLYVNSIDHHIYCFLNGVWKQLDN
jgi:hypothetical protein